MAKGSGSGTGGGEVGPTSSSECPYCRKKDFSGDDHYPPCKKCDDLNHAACVCTAK